MRPLALVDDPQLDVSWEHLGVGTVGTDGADDAEVEGGEEQRTRSR